MLTFSIAMGTYNGGAYLPEQLDSLLRLDPPPIELVIGDDGSTDSTLAILTEFASRASFPVHITRNARRLGYGENFLQAAKRCTGDWVAFCDQDDVWFPTKLGRCAEAIVNGPGDLGLVVHRAIVADSNLGELGRTTWPRAGLYQALSLPPDWLVLGFMQVFRRSLLNEIPSTKRQLTWFGQPDAHDTWICFIANITGSVVVLDECLAIYRRHESNTTEAVGLASKSLLARVTAKFSDNPERRDRADRYRCIADTLSRLAKERLSPARTEQFLRASVKVADLANRMATRAEISSGKSMRKRFQAYCELIRAGAYASSRGGAFGPGEAAIDFLRAFLPRS